MEHPERRRDRSCEGIPKFEIRKFRNSERCESFRILRSNREDPSASECPVGFPADRLASSWLPNFPANFQVGFPTSRLASRACGGRSCRAAHSAPVRRKAPMAAWSTSKRCLEPRTAAGCAPLSNPEGRPQLVYGAPLPPRKTRWTLLLTSSERSTNL